MKAALREYVRLKSCTGGDETEAVAQRSALGSGGAFSGYLCPKEEPGEEGERGDEEESDGNLQKWRNQLERNFPASRVH